jgi:hypothetical protein
LIIIFFVFDHSGKAGIQVIPSIAYSGCRVKTGIPENFGLLISLIHKIPQVIILYVTFVMNQRHHGGKDDSKLTIKVDELQLEQSTMVLQKTESGGNPA